MSSQTLRHLIHSVFHSYSSGENVLVYLRNFGRYKVFLGVMVIVLIAISPGSVRAHQFGLVFVAPLSGENAMQGKQSLDGLMLASEEEDAHEFEESDGHLGGLDSYVFTIDSAQDSRVILEQLDALISAQQPAFITGLFNAKTAKLLENAIVGKNVVLFNPDESAAWQLSKDAPDNLAAVNGQPISAVMQKKYDYVPGASAYRGYIAARLISAVVRTLAQNPADDISATLKAMKQAQKSLSLSY